MEKSIVADSPKKIRLSDEEVEKIASAMLAAMQEDIDKNMYYWCRGKHLGTKSYVVDDFEDNTYNWCPVFEVNYNWESEFYFSSEEWGYDTGYVITDIEANVMNLEITDWDETIMPDDDSIQRILDIVQKPDALSYY